LRRLIEGEEGHVQLYEFPEAAQKLGIKESTLRRWVAHRKIRHHKVGRLVKFTDEDLDSAVRVVEPVPQAPTVRRRRTR
jgi:excisionase family DNA binding protein